MKTKMNNEDQESFKKPPEINESDDDQPLILDLNTKKFLNLENLENEMSRRYNCLKLENLNKHSQG